MPSLDPSQRPPLRAAVRATSLPALRRRDDGGIAIIFGLLIIPLVLAVGLGVDAGLAYNTQSRLQAAVDSAALAGARMVTSDITERKADARKFFDVNYPNDYLGGGVQRFLTSFNPASKEMTVEATVQVPTAFMRLAGIPTVAVSAEAKVQQLVGGVELAMVLDVTDSMNWADPSGGTKLEALRSASNVLLDVIYGDKQFADNVSVSVTAYNSLVNIGSSRTSWLTGFDAAAYGADGWKGCAEARSGTLDRDDSPLADEKITAMLWPPVGSYFNTGNDPNAFCPDSEILPLTKQKQTIADHIAALTADGATVPLPGFVWGWRTISPNWRTAWNLDQGPVDYDDPAIKKAIVFMTDGVTVMHPGNDWFNAYGFTEDGRLGTTDPALAKQEVDDRLLESCALAKAEGIEIYAVMYALSDSYVENLFRACASSSAHFFDAPDADVLDAAFKSIAGRLVSLRISE